MIIRQAGRGGDDGGGELHVYIDDDGDAHVSVTRNRKKHVFQSTEFCTLRGGGRSKNTRQALLALFAAIEADNSADPGAAINFN